MAITVGVLALQGGFAEHAAMLDKAAAVLASSGESTEVTSAVTVRTPAELARCDALVIPGGESTTMALIAERSGLMGPLIDFVRIQKKPTWGTCAGLIFLSKEATGAKSGGQKLVGGLDVRVHRNHFGTQKHSFVADIHMPVLDSETDPRPFPGVFIRAPVVDALLPLGSKENDSNGTSKTLREDNVQILAILPKPPTQATSTNISGPLRGCEDIIAVRQGNILGTSFHAELTDDIRLHKWWLGQVIEKIEEIKKA